MTITINNINSCKSRGDAQELILRFPTSYEVDGDGVGDGDGGGGDGDCDSNADGNGDGELSLSLSSSSAAVAQGRHSLETQMFWRLFPSIL